MRVALAIALLLAPGAGRAWAQTAPTTPPPAETDAQFPAFDPIGDAIAAALPPDQTTDQEADAEAAAPPPVPTARPEHPPYRPMVVAPSRAPLLDKPVMIDETGKSPDGPPTPLDLGYESRIRASVAAAQGLQGPLDGGWTVRSTYGVAVMTLQLVDRGNGYGQLEGAWRSLDGQVSKVGLIDSLDRQPVVLTIRITKSPGKPTTVLTLVPTSDGGWTGEVSDEYGVHQVTMKRN